MIVSEQKPILKGCSVPTGLDRVANGNNASSTISVNTDCVALSGDVSVQPCIGNSPDPDLFPYLSRRLVEVGGLQDGRSLESVGLEAVDAANAMLTLKHGHQAVSKMHGEWSY